MSVCRSYLDGTACPVCKAGMREWTRTQVDAGHYMTRVPRPGHLRAVCVCGYDGGQVHRHLNEVSAGIVAARCGLPGPAAPLLLALWDDGWHLNDALAVAADVTA